MFKIIIKRRTTPDKEAELLKLITKLRMGASGQKGYISGETLRSSTDPHEFLVISVWQNEKGWKEWVSSDERKEIQAKIDALTGTPTTYETYNYPHVVYDA